ncbi:unnamed protein product [Laminaria digitata]
MSTATVPPTRRGKCRSSLNSRPLQFRVGLKTTILLFFSSFARISTSFKASIGQQQHRHGRQLSIDARHAYAATREPPARYAPRRLTWRASSNELSQVTVDVKRSGRNPVDTSQLSSGGSTFYANGYDDGNKDGWVLMQTISGVADDGREVVAVVAPGKYPPGSSVLVEARHVVGKPEGLDWDRAAIFPFLVVNCLWPLLEAGFNESNTRGQTFVVTGGHGSLAPFVVQVLKAWGGKVCCATTKSEGAARLLGAESAVDFRKESYSEALLDFSAVVDTLGREKEGAQRMLKEAKGAAYVSLQPKVLKVAVEEGVLFGAGKILQYQKMIAKDDARTYFLPNVEAMGLVSQVASMVSSKSVKFGAIGTEYVGMQEYMEALAWPKDSDTGLRFGFPGKTNRSWGWLGGNVDDDPFPWEDEDDEEDEEEGEYEVVQQAMAEEDGQPAVPTGEVVGVRSREDLQALTEEGGTILFVSSKSCRACKFLTPYYRKLARKQQQIWFGRVDASSNPELARDLGLKAVPSFVTFRGGEVVTSTSTNSKAKIEKLVDELLHE